MRTVGGVISNLDETMTVGDIVMQLSIAQENIEPAAWNTLRIATNIAIRQIIGGCDQYKGPVLYDPEFEEKMKQYLISATKGDKDGEDF
jgi:hypothetical protein